MILEIFIGGLGIFELIAIPLIIRKEVKRYKLNLNTRE